MPPNKPVTLRWHHNHSLIYFSSRSQVEPGNAFREALPLISRPPEAEPARDREVDSWY